MPATKRQAFAEKLRDGAGTAGPAPEAFITAIDDQDTAKRSFNEILHRAQSSTAFIKHAKKWVRVAFGTPVPAEQKRVALELLEVVRDHGSPGIPVEAKRNELTRAVLESMLEEDAVAQHQPAGPRQRQPKAKQLTPEVRGYLRSLTHEPSRSAKHLVSLYKMIDRLPGVAGANTARLATALMCRFESYDEVKGWEQAFKVATGEEIPPKEQLKPRPDETVWTAYYDQARKELNYFEIDQLKVKSELQSDQNTKQKQVNSELQNKLQQQELQQLRLMKTVGMKTKVCHVQGEPKGLKELEDKYTTLKDAEVYKATIGGPTWQAGDRFLRLPADEAASFLDECHDATFIVAHDATHVWTSAAASCELLHTDLERA